MSTYTLCPIWTGSQLFDPDGIPLAGGKIYTYKAGTSTPEATFVDNQGSTNTNPIVLDASGYVPHSIWLKSNFGYKFVLTDANDVVMPNGTIDNIYFELKSGGGGGGGGGGGTALPEGQIGFGSGSSITSSPQFRYNLDDPDYGQIEIWGSNTSAANASFRIGRNSGTEFNSFLDFSSNVNPVDTDPDWRTAISIKTDWINHTNRVFIPSLYTNGIQGVNLVSTVKGEHGLKPFYQNDGNVVVGPAYPVQARPSSVTVTNTETYLTPTGQYLSTEDASVYRVVIRGTGTSTSASGSIQFKLKIGTNGSTSDTTYYTLSTTPASSGTNVPFNVTMDITFRVSGSSGSLIAGGTFLNNGTTGLSNSAVVVSNGSAMSIDTTSGLYIGVSAVTANSSQTISVQQAYIQRVL